MSEFTGERVIPGLVDANLLNEHLARYRFAARFVHPGNSVLDAGCGSGYGAAALAAMAPVTAVDIAADAIRHARRHFASPAIRFLQAACESLPFADGSFDLVTAFEVIEHLERWRELLTESSRVLKPGGVLLVSTPNKAYYAESRAKAGPNPFHCHEFEYDEFQSALSGVFPHVRLWTQNHAEAIVFAPKNPSVGTLEAEGDAAPENAHFFLAACSQSPLEAGEVFAWLPRSGNLLREREHHIAKLESELTDKDGWLKKLIADHSELQREHDGALAELRRSNEWAETVNQELKERRARIAVLQEEADARLAWIRAAEVKAANDAEDNQAWVQALEARIATGTGEIERLNLHLQSLEADLAARDAWGRSLDAQFRAKAEEVVQLVDNLNEVRSNLDHASAELEILHEQRRMIANSKWIRLGRKLNV
ncbi:MAG: methyltransferase domain-containing protein, partial [Acidobacteriota bacterium]|nr:methyltransferase domain-containing protein [Acidobacteriota bacterium]